MNSKEKSVDYIKYGFVRAGISSLAHRTNFSRDGKAYLHITSLENQKLYICTGMTAFNKDKIPALFNNYEFLEFYEERPPKISNNKDMVVNEIVQSSLIN